MWRKGDVKNKGRFLTETPAWHTCALRSFARDGMKEQVKGFPEIPNMLSLAQGLCVSEAMSVHWHASVNDAHVHHGGKTGSGVQTQPAPLQHTAT